MTDARLFRGFRLPTEVVLWAVRWYLQFPINYCDLAGMLADRGVAVDHVSLYRWVQRFAPEFEKRLRRHLAAGNVEACLGQYEQARACAARAGDQECEARALSGLGDAHYGRGRMRLALEQFRRCRELCRRHGFGRVEADSVRMTGVTR